MWELLHQYRTLFIAAYVVVILVLAVYGFHRSHLVYLYFKNRKRGHTPERRFDDLPVVTVQLPIFNEMYVVERLIEAVAAIDYPHDKLEIQVLDDSTDETREIAARKCAEVRARGLDCKHLSRPTRVGYKAGALDFGLHCARGEFVAVFDADFVPNPSFLRDMIDHFTDAGVGMVQARWGHLNRDRSAFTRAQAVMLDAHFLLEHRTRMERRLFFNFNGTAGVWRRSCIEDAGGWSHDTLTEDLDLSYRAQLRGWRFRFLPGLVVPAELPADVAALMTQQRRWAKGSIQTARKLLPSLFAQGRRRSLELEAFVHLTSNVAYPLLLALGLLLLPVLLGAPQAPPWLVWTVQGAVWVFGVVPTLAFLAIGQRAAGRSWRWIPRDVLAAMVLGIGLSLNNTRAVLEGLAGGIGAWERTPKTGDQGCEREPRSLYPARRESIGSGELALAGYFGLLGLFAWRFADRRAVPFIALLWLGFASVAWASWRRRRV
jgi:cellulose synthase/poly-beta-1,6-N-acetylglucosamine synthase-like glycosyltransferase